MKRGILLIFAAAFVMLSLAGVFASSCNLAVSLVNQDPYPAVQGDSVKLLFQVEGVQNVDCNGATFKVVPGYSFSLQPGDNGLRTLSGSTYVQNYQNYWTVPVTLNVNPAALDGNANLDVYYKPGVSSGNDTSGFLSQRFNVSIQDSHANFEVYVNNYDPATRTITFQILNTAKFSVSALTLTIPEQNKILVKGPNTNIVGDLDANEYTTADFEATPSNGNISMEITYTDPAGVRRSIEKNVTYDSTYFTERASTTGGSSKTIWVVLVIIVAIIVVWYYRRKKKKKLMEEMRKKI